MYWIGLKTLILREFRVSLRFWSVTLAPPVITTILYFTIFGEIIGAGIGSIDGIEYIQYLAPGVIVLWVIPYSFGHTTGGLLGAGHFRYIEELLVSPLPRWAIMTGYVIGGTIRGLLVGLATVLTTLVFTHLNVHSVTVSFMALFLAALVSALGGFITAMCAKSFEEVTTIQILILTPLTYLGGVFNSISSMPGWAQELDAPDQARITPLRVTSLYEGREFLEGIVRAYVK